MMLGSQLNAQNYQSIFGHTETYWVFEWGNTPGFTQDTIFIEKDTLVEGISWKKLKGSRNNIFDYFAGAIIREDTISGKVWYKGFHPFDSSTKLAIDFSLNKGDSFDIETVWGNPPISQKIVDTTYEIDGRKIIEFLDYSFKFQEPTTFIEGVGSNWGIIFKQYYGLVLAHYLLCYYKDGEKQYVNKYYNGECNVHLVTGIRERETVNDFLVYPNPASAILNIRYDGWNIYETIRIYNSAGGVLSNQKFRQQINVANYPPGIYIIQIITKTGKVHSTKFLKNEK